MKLNEQELYGFNSLFNNIINPVLSECSDDFDLILENDPELNQFLEREARRIMSLKELIKYDAIKLEVKNKPYAESYSQISNKLKVTLDWNVDLDSVKIGEVKYFGLTRQNENFHNSENVMVKKPIEIICNSKIIGENYSSGVYLQKNNTEVINNPMSKLFKTKIPILDINNEDNFPQKNNLSHLLEAI